LNKLLPLLLFSALLLVPLMSQDAFAAVKTWDGGGNGVTWADPLNWNPDGVPAANDDVFIDGVTVEIRTAVTVGATGSITLSPTGSNTNIHVHSPGSLSIFGTLTMTDSDDDLSIRDDSTVTVQCTGVVTLADGMIFLSTDTIALETLVNHGTITGTLPGGAGQSNNNIVLRSANSLVQNSGILPTAILNDNGGTLETIPSICVVGGEFLSIDSTALILAGAQTNAVWIMSALAVIGSLAFGALYITSKKN